MTVDWPRSRIGVGRLALALAARAACCRHARRIARRRSERATTSARSRTTRSRRPATSAPTPTPSASSRDRTTSMPTASRCATSTRSVHVALDERPLPYRLNLAELQRRRRSRAAPTASSTRRSAARHLLHLRRLGDRPAPAMARHIVLHAGATYASPGPGRRSSTRMSSPATRRTPSRRAARDRSRTATAPTASTRPPTASPSR